MLCRVSFPWLRKLGVCIAICSVRLIHCPRWSSCLEVEVILFLCVCQTTLLFFLSGYCHFLWKRQCCSEISFSLMRNFFSIENSGYPKFGLFGCQCLELEECSRRILVCMEIIVLGAVMLLVGRCSLKVRCFASLTLPWPFCHVQCVFTELYFMLLMDSLFLSQVECGVFEVHDL